MKHLITFIAALLFSTGISRAETTVGASYCQLTIPTTGIVNILDPSINTAGLHLRTFMVNSTNAGGFSLGVGTSSMSLKFILTAAAGGQGNFEGDLYIPAGDGLYISNASGTQYVYTSYDLVGRAISVSTTVCN